MLKDRADVLAGAPGALNRQDQPWTVKVEGNSIIAQWKWMDATFFTPGQVKDEVKQFTFTVTLGDKGKWKELDNVTNKASGIKMSGGQLSFGGSKSSFSGKTTQKSIQFGVGKNNATGESGVIGFKLDTEQVKRSVRDYLTGCGWKKAGLFG